jgi:glutathione peroxidase
MRPIAAGIATAAFAFTLGCQAPKAGAEPPPDGAKETATVIDHTVTDIDGNTKNLGDFRGKALLIVNVASECGYTPQYAGLEKLWQQYKDRGLVVMGFPSNDFGGQEPGTEAEIKQFCESRFDVTFPMFAKVKVKGDDKAPLYRALTESTGGSEVKWNFTKFLVGKDGKVIERFASGVEPLDAKLTEAVERALK